MSKQTHTHTSLQGRFNFKKKQKNKQLFIEATAVCLSVCVSCRAIILLKENPSSKIPSTSRYFWQTGSHVKLSSEAFQSISTKQVHCTSGILYITWKLFKQKVILIWPHTPERIPAPFCAARATAQAPKAQHVTTADRLKTITCSTYAQPVGSNLSRFADLLNMRCALRSHAALRGAG